MRTPSYGHVSSVDRFRASRMPCSIPTKVASFARQRRCSEPMLSHRQESRGALGGVRSRVARSGPGPRPTDPEHPMRTSETLLLDFIRQSPQFRIPVNQRRYAWTKRHCRQLWDDILDAGERQDVREHFLGPIMYVAAVDPLNAHWAPCLVYDGQQRLTTITLILKTLSRHLKDDTAPDGFGPDQIRSEYLVNPFCKGDQHYRLVLKAGDAETLLALIHDRPLPAEPSSRIMDARAFFEKRIKQIGPDVSPLCAGLRKLRIVAFQLKEGEDNPYRIFETMNTCGRDLTCADMIGNFILMPLDRERQERLYADHLRPIERGFERHGEEHFDVFIRDFLTLRTGEVPKQGEEYAAFKTHARSRRVEDAGPEALSADLRSCADHYRAMVLGEEPDAELALAFGELARLDMKPVWPFLLHLYGDYAGKRLSRHDLLTLTRLVTAYVMRRTVCGHRPAAPPPVFATASRSVDPERYVESVRAYFLCLPDGVRLPFGRGLPHQAREPQHVPLQTLRSPARAARERRTQGARAPLVFHGRSHHAAGRTPAGHLEGRARARLGADLAEPPPYPRQPDPHRLQPGDGKQAVPRQARCRGRDTATARCG